MDPDIWAPVPSSRTENDASYTVNTGNKDPHRGFGHTCISVDHLQAACDRIEAAGYKFQKKISDGRMRNIAFALDPDGYVSLLLCFGRSSCFSLQAADYQCCSG